MALNTPKRVRTQATFPYSPPECINSNDSVSASVASSPLPQSGAQQKPHHHNHHQHHHHHQYNQQHQPQQQHHQQTTSLAWSSNGCGIEDVETSRNNFSNTGQSFSPISSCESPEFRPMYNQQYDQNVSGGVQQDDYNYQNQHNQQQQQQQVLDQSYSSTGSNNSSINQQDYRENRENRRGRPRSEALTTLMFEGSTSPSSIKCCYCNRVFPREKSLQAHLRTHTGERPYPCDYPGCSRAFTQSGQLKTHQRLHTGERPFMCSAISCQQRFTHANRHCPDHPYDQLKRNDDFVINQTQSELNSEVLRWLEKYRLEKEDRTPTRKTPKRRIVPKNNENELSVGGGGVDGGDGSGNLVDCDFDSGTGDDGGLGCGGSNNNGISVGELITNSNNNNNNRGGSANVTHTNISIDGLRMMSPTTPTSNPYKSRKGLMVELDMNVGLDVSPIAPPKCKVQPKIIKWTDPSTFSQEEDSDDDGFCNQRPTSTFNPKKKWLREAWQDDLAKPLDSLISSPPPPPVATVVPLPTPSVPTSTIIQCQNTKLQTTPPPPQQQQQQQQQQSKTEFINPNQMRPTVLMVASKDRTMPLLANGINTTLSTNSQLDRRNYHQQHNRRHDESKENLLIFDNATPKSTPFKVTLFNEPNQHSNVDYHHQSYHQHHSHHQNNHKHNSQSDCNSSPGSEHGGNRKWLGALALMQLATNEDDLNGLVNNSETTTTTTTTTNPIANQMLNISSQSPMPLQDRTTKLNNESNNEATFCMQQQKHQQQQQQ